MPKQPGGYTKFQRVQAVKSVLERWGRLNKGQIDQHVASIMGCPEEVLERALYRDLEDLEQLNEVVVLRFTRDGQLIDDYDPESHRNIYCEWALPGAEKNILGGARLEESGITFLATPRLVPFFQVRTPSDGPRSNHLGIYFRADQNAYCLSLSLEALPTKIILSRAVDGSKSELAHQLTEKAFGKRSCCLMVPVPNLSKIREGGSQGHLMLEAKAPGEVTVHDLNSKNGTSYRLLTARDADSVFSELTRTMESTFTDGVRQTRQHLEMTTLKPGSSVNLKLPVLVHASSAFEIFLKST